MAGTKGLSLPALVVVLFAGCGDAPAWSLGDPVPGFVAEYTGEHGSSRLELSGPVDVLLAGGSKAPAYRLQYALESPAAGAFPSVTYYLDGDLRLLAHDVSCHAAPGYEGCTEMHYSRSWYQAGSLPPFGLAYPAIIAAEGDLVDHGTSPSTPFEYTIDKNDGQTIITIPPGQVPLDRLEGRSGRLTYVQDRLLPDIEGGAAPVYGEGKTLDSVESKIQPRRPPLPSHAPVDLLFPEEDQDHFGLGIAHRDFRHALEEHLEENGFDDVCVTSYILHLSTGSDPLLPQIQESTTQVSFWVIDGNTLRVFAVTATSDALRGFSYSVEQESTRPASISCADVRRSPWPQGVPTGFLAEADAWFSDGSSIEAFVVGIGAYHPVLLDSSYGWYTYKALYRPGWVADQPGPVAYESYSLTYDPHRMEWMAYSGPRALLEAR